MLTIDPNERACINEVNAYLDAIQYRRPLPSSRAHRGKKNSPSNITPFWNEDLYNKSNQSEKKIPTYIQPVVDKVMPLLFDLSTFLLLHLFELHPRTRKLSYICCHSFFVDKYRGVEQHLKRSRSLMIVGLNSA